MNTTELKKIIKKELNSLEPCEEGLEEFETKDLKDISNGSKVWFASRNVRTCKIALESGLFDVNMENNDGKTALMYVGREDYNKVKLLLDNGADVRFYQVNVGIQGGQLGLYLFVGFFTDRIPFQQGVLAKHAVFCQL